MAFLGRDQVGLAVHSLAGLLEGIAIDGEISDGELDGLRRWLVDHSDLLFTPPFDELAARVEDVLADGCASDEEREGLVEFCQAFAEDNGVAIQGATDAIRRLHAVVVAIAVDGQVTTQEAVDLREWLRDHEEMLDCWPFSEVAARLNRALADGRLAPDEQAELLAFFSQFDRPAPDAQPDPTVERLGDVIDADCEVEFRGKRFCFTGRASRPRNQLLAAVVERGGLALDRFTSDVDYLVVGGEGRSAGWLFNPYGRKLRDAVELRRQGAAIWIVSEARFLSAVEAHPASAVDVPVEPAANPLAVNRERRVFSADVAARHGESCAWRTSVWRSNHALLRIVRVGNQCTVYDSTGSQVGVSRRITECNVYELTRVGRWLQCAVVDGIPFATVCEAAAAWTRGTPITKAFPAGSTPRTYRPPVVLVVGGRPE